MPHGAVRRAASVVTDRAPHCRHCTSWPPVAPAAGPRRTRARASAKSWATIARGAGAIGVTAPQWPQASASAPGAIASAAPQVGQR